MFEPDWRYHCGQFVASSQCFLIIYRWMEGHIACVLLFGTTRLFPESFQLKYELCKLQLHGTEFV